MIYNILYEYLLSGVAKQTSAAAATKVESSKPVLKLDLCSLANSSNDQKM